RRPVHELSLFGETNAKGTRRERATNAPCRVARSPGTRPRTLELGSWIPSVVPAPHLSRGDRVPETCPELFVDGPPVPAVAGERSHPRGLGDASVLDRGRRTRAEGERPRHLAGDREAHRHLIPSERHERARVERRELPCEVRRIFLAALERCSTARVRADGLAQLARELSE